MQQLVFNESGRLDDVPFTTSEVIAKYAEVEHRAVRQLIRKHENDLEEFGKTTFEMSKITEGRGRKSKIYHLNEQQATLLITYLDNTEPVRQFKKALVKQFFEMQQELYARRLERGSGKAVHKEMTDAIKEKEFSPHYYKHFTDLAYKTAVGFTAKQLREARGVNNKSSPLDYLTAEELAAVNKREMDISVLIMLDLDYPTIKATLNNQGVIYQTTLKIPIGKAVVSGETNNR
ncbi:Rha family transcriptional regulator [Candidatus Enterococcus clewellii]|uniref:Rha family phage regulatory protein n=1 Tax=Candidatus Enterococcus clewellii TaxID=1834193 RepID=A0A242JV24_9ENTE|nr:Rha family transcriptional regulator [Enterococcus sp. 9E7_DIV0242]OTP06746.1 hypothetical protein A5888_004201 [Enterococcus sp. 9E7_DIV0242]